MYGGRASDKYITADSRDLLNYAHMMGGKVMCNKGFAGTYRMNPLGVELIMPSSKGADRLQFTSAEISQSANISRCRVHVERIIQRIKSFHIFDSDLKQTQKHVAEHMSTVCAYLTNFQRPILK